MTPGPPLFPLTPKPMVVTTNSWLVGYCSLDEEESEFRIMALDRHAPMVSVWLRLLTLFHEAVLEQKGHPLDAATSTHAEQLVLEIFAIALGSAKAVFDNILTGKYLMAFMWIRHMLESWVVMVAVTARPDQAYRWYNDPGRKDQLGPPSRTKMHLWIKESPKTHHWVALLGTVKADIKRLDKLAHPAEQGLNQTISEGSKRIKSGSTYNAQMAIQALHDGAQAISILLGSFSESVPMMETWHAELQAVISAHKAGVDESPETDETAALR